MALPTRDRVVVEALPSAIAPEWHTLPVDVVLSHLHSAPEGLADVEVERRLARYGPNELEAADRVSPWAVLLGQFKNVLIIILLIATAISAFVGHGVEAIAIAVIVLFAVVLGFVQEYRAERAIEALRRMAAPTVTVIRDGQEIRDSGTRARARRPHSVARGRQGGGRRAADRVGQSASGRSGAHGRIGGRGEEHRAARSGGPGPRRPQQHGFCWNNRHLRPWPCRRRRHRHEYPVRPDCEDVAIRRIRQDASAAESR